MNDDGAQDLVEAMRAEYDTAIWERDTARYWEDQNWQLWTELDADYTALQARVAELEGLLRRACPHLPYTAEGNALAADIQAALKVSR